MPDGISIKVDPDQLARVLVNLLKNAREALEGATQKPARAVHHRRTSPKTGDGLVLSISDNGPGLPPRARDNLFVAFEGSAKAGGTGLGLAIARELVEAHGGKLRYIPLDPGTRFDIALPNRPARLNALDKPDRLVYGCAASGQKPVRAARP